MFSDAFLHSPAWVDRFDRLNLLHDTQDPDGVPAPVGETWDAVRLMRHPSRQAPADAVLQPDTTVAA